MFGRKFDFRGPFMMEKNTSCSRYLDSPFRIQFWYWLRYRPKVSANLGFGFGIGPKPTDQNSGFGYTLVLRPILMHDSFALKQPWRG